MLLLAVCLVTTALISISRNECQSLTQDVVVSARTFAVVLAGGYSARRLLVLGAAGLLTVFVLSPR